MHPYEPGAPTAPQGEPDPLTSPGRPRVRLRRLEHPPDHPLMPVSRAAALLGCSDMTIRRRIAARQFPAVRIGRKSLVPRSFVEGLLAQAEAGRTVVVDELATEWVDDTNHAALLDGEQGQARGGATGIERKASRS